MLVVFSTIFVTDTNITFVYYFVVFLNLVKIVFNLFLRKSKHDENK